MKDSTLGFGLCGIVIIAMMTKFSLTGNPFLITQNPEPLDKTLTIEIVPIVPIFIIILSVLGVITSYYEKKTTI